MFIGPLVALLRGGAWIEILEERPMGLDVFVALLRGGAWIEIVDRRCFAKG